MKKIVVVGIVIMFLSLSAGAIDHAPIGADTT
jgi:hypothetical protein